MTFTHFVNVLEKLSNYILIIPGTLTLIAGISLTIKTRFVQIRKIPTMLKILFSSVFYRHKKDSNSHTIQASKALFTAMATTIGISSIVAPVIAIRLGGPGALAGFLMATLLGGAVTFTEVTLALTYRKKLKDGTIMGGPMQYLKAINPFLATSYAYGGIALMVIWSARQANTLSDLLFPYHVPHYLTGLILAIIVTLTLLGGIKRISNATEKIVPTMFFLYIGAAIWIVLCNAEKLPGIFSLIFGSIFSKEAIMGAAVGSGMLYVVRWGLFGAFQNNEAGMGTAAIPHSMADTKDPEQQGILSMVSIFSHGIICFLSGLVILLSGTWENLSIGLGINVISTSFGMYFSTIGPIILAISAMLFAYSTILGNSYNGSQCFSFLTTNRKLNIYYAITAILIFIGAISDVKFIWVITDFFIIPVALPNIIGILILSFKRKKLFKDINP
jgi:alanine or glycine:cation symporter, AGCS family